MSKRTRAARSQAAALNVQTTERIAQPPAEPNAHIPEKIMEASQENTEPTPTTEPPSLSPVEAATEKPALETLEPAGPTAKALAEAEEANAARVIALARQQSEAAEQGPEPVSILDLAAKGRDALHEAMRQHQAKAKAKDYVPPPRTERQMSALQAELEAGRRTQQRAEAQQANRPPPEPPKANDGFTTPVYRPDNMVPDPMMGNGAHGGGVYQPIKTD